MDRLRLRRFLRDDNQKKMAIVLVVLSVVVFFVVIMPKLQQGSVEGLDDAMTEENNQMDALAEEGVGEALGEGTTVADAHVQALDPEGPYVGPQVGTLMDGPGYAEAEWDKRGPSGDVYTRIPSNYYFLDDGADGEMSIQHNLCSKSCCSESWPTPHKLSSGADPYVCKNKNKFVPSRIMCNNSFQDSSCLCLTKKQASFLYRRGGNGREWF